MAFDYKKEYREFYMPPSKPGIITVPSMNYIAVRGQGDPNAEEGEYKQSIGLLYGIAFTIKMSKKSDHRIEGYFDYVVPPLEGFWWQDGVKGIDYARKENFNWISAIRLPDFVTKADFEWAIRKQGRKRKPIFPRLSFSPMMRDYASNVCMSVLMMTSRLLLHTCTNTWRARATSSTLRISACIMKSISVMPGKLLPKSEGL